MKGRDLKVTKVRQDYVKYFKPKNNFKSKGNFWLTRGLVWETRERRPDFLDPNDSEGMENVHFHLGDEDRVINGKYVFSLKKLYLSCTDPTEYEFATRFLGGWDHWQAFSKSYCLEGHIEDWRKELEIRLRSQALKAITEMAQEPGNKNAYAANKLLLDKGWKAPQEIGGKRGRPSKEEIRTAANQLARDSHSVDKDFELIQANKAN